ncbi:ATP-binding protein [Microaceticoccus formicicus]|uniref:ATP-binding protein n=1 Tax=Microaceticoccus formicicus TaxID=3118105 RepID=UPI003CCFFF8A|nr:AAA family ATPase [Peptoniphilaceae bacterium AMB_02]
MLNKLLISSFGKFNNTNIKLSDGLNIIIGDNEAGKSTIHRFIKSMFYGFAKPETSRIIIDQLEHIKYKPWFNDSYHGSMEVLYNNEKYLIYHNFNTNIFEIRNLSNGTEVDLASSDTRDIGNYFLNMNSIVFDRLLNIQLINLLNYNGNNELLKDYLLNNYYGNLSDLSISKTVNKLNTELEKIGTDRISNKEMGIINKKIDALNQKLSVLYGSIRTLDDLRTKRIGLINEKKELERIYFYSKKLYDYSIKNRKSNKIVNNQKSNYISKPQDELNLDEYNYLLEIENYLLEAISYKKDILEVVKPSKNNSFFYLKTIFLVVINIVILFSKLSLFHKSLAFLLLNLTFIGLLFYNSKYKTNKSDESTMETKNEIEALNTEISRLEKEKSDILRKRNVKSIKDYFNHLNTKLSSEIESNINMKSQEMIEELNFTPLVEWDVFTKEKYDLSTQSLAENKRNLSKIEFEIESLENSIKCIRSYNEQLKELHIEKNNMEEEVIINKTILDAIRFASSEFSKKINSNISNEAGNILSFLTDDKYTKLIIDENLLPLVYDNKLNNFVEIDSLSTGTIQTVYLALSIALNISRNTDSKHPLILDEVTNHLDNDRREQVLKYLSLISENTQVIYFSNSSSDIDILKDLNHDYNIIRI